MLVVNLESSLSFISGDEFGGVGVAKLELARMLCLLTGGACMLGVVEMSSRSCCTASVLVGLSSLAVACWVVMACDRSIGNWKSSFRFSANVEVVLDGFQ